MAGVYREGTFQYKDTVEWDFPFILRITGKAYSWGQWGEVAYFLLFSR